MAIDPMANCNFSIPSSQCTLQTCCLSQTAFLYLPVLGGNAFFTAWFGLFILIHLAQTFWFKTWSYSVAMLIGLIFEVIGYAARVSLHFHPFSDNGFLLYLIFLTIAPVFISAAIYLSLARIIVAYGEHLSYFRPRTIAYSFMVSDLISLILQAIGGAIAYVNDPGSAARQVGVDIMIAGLLFQAVSLVLFLFVMAMFAWSCRAGALEQDPARVTMRNRAIFKAFIGGLVFATILILIRSIFRVVELWGGFRGDLWNDETDFLVLDGAMVGLAVLLLTIFHPGFAFGAFWKMASQKKTSKRKSKAKNDENGFTSSSEQGVEMGGTAPAL